MQTLLFGRHGEFRVWALYLLAVLVYGTLANLYTPVLEVVWDMVFYKSLAYGLHHFASFNLRHFFPVPPLYPLAISPGFFAPDFLSVEIIQSWINPALYFLGLFPLYAYSRRLLTVQMSVGVCLLYLFYPSSIYTQWTLSENLAVPLTIGVFYLAVRLLTDPSPRMWDGTWLGIALAALVLTRIFLIAYCVAVIVWLAWRGSRKDRDPAPWLMAFSLSWTIVISVWWGLGYFTEQQIPLIYANFNTNSPHQVIALFGSIFSAHWSGLWLEGGLLLPSFVVSFFLYTRIGAAFQRFYILFREEGDPRVRPWIAPQSMEETFADITDFVMYLGFVFTLTVSAYYVLRLGIEDWSISLRYIFYWNLISLPLAISVMGSLRGISWKRKFSLVVLFFAACALLSLGFFLPDVWQKLITSHTFFTNAPSLDFLYQLHGEGPARSAALVLAITVLAGIPALISRRTGLVLLAILLIYIQAGSMDFTLQIRCKAIQDLGIRDIHAFCREMEKGKWNGLPVYCEEDVPHLVPNLNYWIQCPAGELAPGAPRPGLPFLLFTPYAHDDGTLVFESGKLKAYLYEKTDDDAK